MATMAKPPAEASRPKRRALRMAGLFAGIGGFELGLRRSGHEPLMVCEIEPGARAVLTTHLAEVRLHDDVRSLKSFPRGTDIVVAGFPCQDLSQAGKTLGIRGSRSGLVGEIFRLLRRQRLPWVVLENVPFMLQLSRGRAMEVVVAAIEDLGYRWAYRVVNSRAFGLPQRRERVVFVASLEDDPRDVLFADDAGEPEPRTDALGRVACGFYWTEGTRGLGWAIDGVPTLKGGSTIGIPSPPAIVMPDGRVVIPNICDAERMQGFEPNWTAPALSVSRPGHRWKLVGNAVTVDMAHWLGRRLRNPSSTGRDVVSYPLKRTSAWPRAAFNVGDGRFGSPVSAFPVHTESMPLDAWLRFDPSDLSAKATAGFLARFEAGSLRRPDGFIEILRKHLQSVGRKARTPAGRPQERAEHAHQR